jgi:hypothetical protein
MVLWLIIAAVLVVFLVTGAVMDHRSRRVRGRVGRVRVPGGEMSNRLGLRASEQLSKFDAGPSQIRHARGEHTDD